MKKVFIMLIIVFRISAEGQSSVYSTIFFRESTYFGLDHCGQMDSITHFSSKKVRNNLDKHCKAGKEIYFIIKNSKAKCSGVKRTDKRSHIISFIMKKEKVKSGEPFCAVKGNKISTYDKVKLSVGDEELIKEFRKDQNVRLTKRSKKLNANYITSFGSSKTKYTSASGIDVLIIGLGKVSNQKKYFGSFYGVYVKLKGKEDYEFTGYVPRTPLRLGDFDGDGFPNAFFRTERNDAYKTQIISLYPSIKVEKYTSKKISKNSRRVYLHVFEPKFSTQSYIITQKFKNEKWDFVLCSKEQGGCGLKSGKLDLFGPGGVKSGYKNIADAVLTNKKGILFAVKNLGGLKAGKLKTYYFSKSDVSYDFGPLVIDKYPGGKLTIGNGKNGLKIKQNAVIQQLNDNFHYSDWNQGGLRWAGDLDGDNQIDILFGSRLGGETGERMILFLSTFAREGEFVGVAGTFFLDTGMGEGEYSERGFKQ